MAQLLINIGESVNDKRGDPLRTAFDKVNQNFTELFTTDTSTKYHLGDDTQFVDIDPDSGMIVIQSGYDKSMPVYIKGANCSDGGVGGNVVIEAGGAPLGIDNFINGTTGNVEIAAHQTTIDSEGKVWTFRDDGYLETPDGHTIFTSSNSIGLRSQYGAGLIAGQVGLVFEANGTVNIQSIFPRTFTAYLDTTHMIYPDPAVALDPMTDPWRMDVTFSIVDGQIVTTIEQIFPILTNPGYETGYTFGFTEDDHGIPGYGFSIELQDVVLPGAAGWTANIVVPPAPALPSTIRSESALVLTGDDGIVMDGRITLLDNPAPGKGIYGPSGLSLYAKNGNQLALYWNADDATNPYEGIPDHDAKVVATISDWAGYIIEITTETTDKSWTFQPNGVLALPVGGDIVDSNGDSVLENNNPADRLVAGDKSVILDTNGDLTLPAGGEIKSADGTGNVVIEANNGTTRTWTFDGTGTLSLPSAIDNASIYHVGSIGIKTDGLSGGQQWTYDDTGKLTFPDTHLTIENSTIGRKVVSIFDDGIVHTEDAEGSRLVFTDTSTSLETYNDPDGVNNIIMARHYTSGAIAGLEVYTEIVSGRTGTSLVVTGSGVTITGGDGVVDNTWNFDIGGGLGFPDDTQQTTAYPGASEEAPNTVLAGPASDRDYAYQNDGTTLSGWTVEALLGSVTVDATQGNTGSSIKITHGTSSFHANFGAYFQNRTVEFDIMFDTNASAAIVLGANSDGTDGIALTLKQGDGGTDSGFGYSTGWLFTSSGPDTNVFDTMTWYNVKIVIGNGGVGSISYYINGVLAGNNSLSPLNIYTYWGFLSNSGNVWIDNIKVYNPVTSGAPVFRALVADDLPAIAELSNNGNTVSLNSDGALTLPGELTFGGQSYTNNAIIWENGNGAVINYNSVDNYFVIKSNDAGLGKYWKFYDNGDTELPGKIKHNGSVAELDLGVSGTDNVLLKTTDDVGETQLLLSALAGASLTTNHNVLVSAGNGTTITYNNYYAQEMLFQVTEVEWESSIAPAVSPWAGLNSYDAYPIIMEHMPWTGGGLPPPLNISSLAQSASNAYTAWQEEVAATNVSVSVTDKAWTFTSDGKLTLPEGLGSGNSDIYKSSATPSAATVRAAWDYYQEGEASWIAAYNSDGPMVDITTRPWYNVPSHLALPILTANWAAQQAGSGFSTPAISAAFYNQLRAAINLAASRYNAWQALVSTIEITSAESTWSFGSDGVLVLPIGGDIVDGNSVSVLTAKEPKFEILSSGIGLQVSAGKRYAVDTSTAPVYIYLPANPELGDAVFFVDCKGTFGVGNELNITGVTNNIAGSGSISITTPNENIGLFYNGTEWRYYA